jgi:hypothetical protein
MIRAAAHQQRGHALPLLLAQWCSAAQCSRSGDATAGSRTHLKRWVVTNGAPHTAPSRLFATQPRHSQQTATAAVRWSSGGLQGLASNGSLRRLSTANDDARSLRDELARSAGSRRDAGLAALCTVFARQQLGEMTLNELREAREVRTCATATVHVCVPRLVCTCALVWFGSLRCDSMLVLMLLL